jgi:aerobic-type carbon monoxide dehydrogenase small subunit (CoxS/CutS family)
MSNGSPHDPNSQGEGYRHGQGYADAYGGYGEHPDYGYGEYPEYGDYQDYGDYPDYGGQQRQAQRGGGPQQQPYPSYPQDGSYPQEGWGGESDQDATAFVQLPAGPLPPPGAGVEAWGPLAAPGTGQGGYTPPPLDPAEVAGQQPGGQAVPPPPETGAASTGQWAMPFGEDPSSYGRQYGGQHGGQYEQHSQQQGQQPGGASAFGSQGGPGGQSGPGGAGGQGGAAPTGQGAAAALAGSHEARTRRPLGTGGGAAAGETEEAEGIGSATRQGGMTAPQQSPAQQARPVGPSSPASAHYQEAEAEAHARRQVPFDGHQAAFDGQDPGGHDQGGHGAGVHGAGPGPAAAEASGGGVAEAYAARQHESDQAPAGSMGAPDVQEQGGESGAESAGQGETGEAGARPMGTVRSGLPFTPSSGPATTAAQTPPPSPEPQADPQAAGGGENGSDDGAGAAGDSRHVHDSGAPAPGPSAAQAQAAADPEQAHEARQHEQAQHEARQREPREQGETATDAEVSEEPPLELAPELGGEHPHVSYVLHVNGVDRPVTDAWIGESLLYVLRERLGLAGAKDGCSQGECGACSVQVDGRLVASCLVPAATAAGSEIRTVEGLAVDGVPSDVQRALTESGAVQCGFCVPGLAMTVHDLLEGNHAPSELETRKAICGNLCRCSGYRGVLDAVRTVVTERAEQAAREEAEAEAEAEAYERELAEASAHIPHQPSHGGGAQYPGGGGA